MRTPLQQALALAVVLLNAYCFGANCVERFVNYQTWSLIPADAFKTYHRAQQPLVRAFVVAPLVIGFVLQLLLVCNVPAGIDPWVPRIMILASAVGAVCTIALQLPIHAALNRSGYSPALMRKLFRTDWIRKAADVIRMSASAVFLHQLLTIR